ncbi:MULTISPECIES: hypothetical protein [Burkholderia cepacia complex]|nr:hypothetical protein [Burkholderia stabilis]GAU05354.1 hypothetical protein BSLA_02f3617 [Burkholderia stabilis]
MRDRCGPFGAARARIGRVGDSQQVVEPQAAGWQHFGKVVIRVAS